MRQINLRTILTWLAIFCSIGVKADVVTVQDALRLVKNVIMSEKPVSYYLKEQDEKSKEWVIFVDMHPNQNWCHEAYLFSVPKNLRGCFITIVNLREVCLGALPLLQ